LNAKIPVFIANRFLYSLDDVVLDDVV